MADSFFSKLRSDPATKDLLGALGGFASAQVGNVATKAVGRVAGEDSATSGAVEGATDAASEGKSKLWGGIKGAFKKMVGGSAKRPTNIYEQVFVGVPVERAFEEWTNYAQFPEFMKGPEQVTENDDGTTSWTAKIFLNRRSWKATVEEQTENRRIKWSTEAAKGTIDGCITFTPIGDNATLILYTLEYRPKGFFEWWGNRWRTVGRRARLDVKHFGRHVMMLPVDEQDEEDEQDEDEQDDNAGTDEGDLSAEQPEEAGEPEEPEDGGAEPDEPDEPNRDEPGSGEPRRRGPDRRPRKPRQPRPPRE